MDQMWGMGITLSGGMIMNFPETTETVVEDFRDIGPTVIITASWFWESLASKIRVKISDSSFIKRFVYKTCMKIGGSVVDRESEKMEVPLYLKFLYWIASRIMFRPLMDRTGCLQFRGAYTGGHPIGAYTGGHPISPDVIRFFRANGINLKQCYGLTESGGIFQVQPDDEVKLETVGVPLPGYIDDDGHLLIIGRKAEIMKTREGEAFSPDFIETRLKFSPYIKEAVIFGEGQPYITAFINLDFGNVGNWAEERKIAYTTYIDLSQQPEVEELIGEEIRQVNTQLPEPMQLVHFILLYKLLDADDEEL
ncbi:MAG: AMP-binding protein, partial [Deltaproteobacteria bacterium]|nr:AMP-binding protein [Deltaproteobacteria bacterium]